MKLPGSTLLGAHLAAAFLIAYFAVATTVGFHGPPARWEAYGEPPLAGPVKQPICFWTDLAFVAAGLIVLARLDRAARDDAPSNAMARPTPFSVGFGLVVVWMGPGSMLEHGTLTSTWGWFDASSIHWLGLYVLGYLALRRSAVAFWTSQAVTWTAVGAATWFVPALRGPASVVLLVLMGVALLAWLVAGWRAGRFGPDAWWAFARSAVALVAAIAFLVTGATGGPTAPWGHGAWHMCSALAVLSVHDILRSEREPT